MHKYKQITKLNFVDYENRRFAFFQCCLFIFRSHAKQQTKDSTLIYSYICKAISISIWFFKYLVIKRAQGEAYLFNFIIAFLGHKFRGLAYCNISNGITIFYQKKKEKLWFRRLWSWDATDFIVWEFSMKILLCSIITIDKGRLDIKWWSSSSKWLSSNSNGSKYIWYCCVLSIGVST